MIRVFDPEGICIEEYRSWEEAARAFLKMLNEVDHENYTMDARPSLEDLEGLRELAEVDWSKPLGDELDPPYDYNAHEGDEEE